MLARGLRNNNPGNIEDSPFARSQPGYLGTDGRFAQFDTIDNGYGAMASLYNSGGYRGLNTVNQIIRRWAPSSDGNDVPAYAGYVAKRLGVHPDEPLNKSDPAQMRAFAQAQAEFENGPGALSDHMPQQQQAPQMADEGTLYPNPRSGPDFGAALSGLGAGLVTAVNPAAGAQLQQNFNQMMLANRPKIMQTTDMYGQQHIVAVDPRTGQPIQNAKALAAAQGGGSSGNMGEDASAAYDRFFGLANRGTTPDQLKGILPPGEENVLQRMIEGRAQPVGGMARKAPIWNARIMAASTLDPTWDETTWGERHKTAMDFAAGGKAGVSLNAINTADHHFANALRSGVELGNTPLPALNWLKNGFLEHTGDPRVDKFASDINAITNEMGKAYNSGHITDSELSRWRQTINTSKSPKQIISTLSEWHDLLNGKRTELNRQYESIMHKPLGQAEPTEFHDALANVASGGAAQSAAPTIVNPKTRQRMILKGGQWQPL